MAFRLAPPYDGLLVEMITMKWFKIRSIIWTVLCGCLSALCLYFVLIFFISYQCGDYILNDNMAGDIQALRSCLHTIATNGQLLSAEVADRHKRLLRSCSVVALGKGLVVEYFSWRFCFKIDWSQPDQTLGVQTAVTQFGGGGSRTVSRLHHTKCLNQQLFTFSVKHVLFRLVPQFMGVLVMHYVERGQSSFPPHRISCDDIDVLVGHRDGSQPPGDTTVTS